MPEYSPVIKEGAIKNKQFQIVAKFTLSPQKRTITVRELLAMCVGKLKFSEVNNVRQMSIIDGQGRRCAIGKFVNNVFIPGAGFTIRRPAQTTGSGSGGGSGEGSDADYASFEPSLLYPTDFSFGAEPPTDKCTLANKKCCPTSSGPIRYFDGKVVHTVTEIDGNGELPWGHTRSYDNTAPFPVDQRNGYRWKLDKVPYLNVFNEFNSISDLDSLDREITQVVISGGRGASFLTQGGGYVALGNGSETMRHRQEIHAYEIRWADGAVALFNDFDDEFVAQGCLRSMTLADGHTVTYFYNADKSLACMERVFHEGGVEVREEIGYEYAVYSDGVSRIGTVTYRRSEDGGLIWMNLKRIEYTYYRGNEFHGSLGDLKLATTMTRAGNDWIDDGTYYYRYYKEGEQKGFIHALKYILEPAEYVQFRKFMPLDSIDSQLAPYATNYFEYDGQKRVVLENVDGGRPASRFAYSEGASGSNKNHWAMKTTETLPDGSVKIYYTNRDANVLLTAERPSASAEGQQIVNYYTFDDEGNQVQHATPESIASYKDYNTYSYNSELVVNLHSGQGLIRKNVYYSGVTGQPNGKLFRETIQRGNYGTPITVAEYEYAEKKLTDTAGNVLQQESFLSKTTRFAGEQNDKPVVVRYEYDFAPGTLRVVEKRTIQSAVSTERNGSGEEAVTVERYDEAGRVVWSRNELGSVTYHQYAPGKGWRIRTIEDADLTRRSDFAQSPPQGWSSGGDALHRVTDVSYDYLGRPVETLGSPVAAVLENGNGATIQHTEWIVYDDAQRTVRSANGYVTLDDAGMIVERTITNPVMIIVRDIDGQVTDRITAFRDHLNGALTANDTFPRERWLTWNKHSFVFGRETARRQYAVIPETGDGVAGQDFAETVFGYDCRNRQNRIVAPDGTISRTVVDWRGNPIQSWIGTNDAGATDTSPKGTHPDNNMFLVGESEFGGASSCSSCSGAGANIRVAIQHVDEESVRVTELGYDWRGRQTHTFHDEDADGNITYDVTTFDNMDRVVKEEKYLLTSNYQDPNDPGDDGGGYYGGGKLPPEPVDPTREEKLRTNLTEDDRLLARSEQFYDERGQMYRVEQSVVDPNCGIVRGKIVFDTWFDAAGRSIRQAQTGQRFIVENVFDSLDRQIATRMVTADGTVLQQEETLLDIAGKVLFTTQKERTFEAVGSGELSLATEPKGEFRHVGFWYDPAGRQIAMADFGIARTPEELPICIKTYKLLKMLEKLVPRLQSSIDVAKLEFSNIASALEPARDMSEDAALLILQEAIGTLRTEELVEPQSVVLKLRALIDSLRGEIGIPDSSDDVLVTRAVYDPSTGFAVATIDTMDRIHRKEYNNQGRVVRTIANAVEGETGSDVNVTVEYSYSIDGKLTAMTAVNPYTGNQLTRYIYGIVAGENGSLVTRNDLLFAEIYPDADAGTENSLEDCVVFGYNIAGERIWKRDQNGTVHEYVYDNFGRQLRDCVTAFGTGVDGTVRRIETAYTVVGNVAAIISRGENDKVLNQVMYQYDQNGQLGKEYQAHDGAIVFPNTPFIGYEYDTIDNGLSLKAQVYPGGKRVGYEYDDLGRATTLSDDGNALVQYTYHGLETPMKTEYVEPGLTLDYTVPGTLDRFGRITDHAWKRADGTDVVRIRHKYDRAGNRLYRNDMVLQDADELYRYDRLDQLVGRERGGLGANFTSIQSLSKNFEEKFTFDATGNWMNFKQDRNGDGTWNLDQNRMHNAANETLTIAGNGSLVAHDRNGNMVCMPKPDDWSEGMDAKYDAWNRMVEVVGIAKYAYDGRNFRIKKSLIGETVRYYHNRQWQILEERSDVVTHLFVWGRRYIDDLAYRQNGDERLYSLADPNWNVVAVVDSTGNVQERYTYDAFGKRSVFGANQTARDESALAWNRAFTGQMLDDETRLMLYRNRFYQTGLGAFIQRDPLVYEAEDENLFRYVSNNPSSKTDAYGLWGNPGRDIKRWLSKALDASMAFGGTKICLYIPLAPVGVGMAVLGVCGSAEAAWCCNGGKEKLCGIFKIEVSVGWYAHPTPVGFIPPPSNFLKPISISQVKRFWKTGDPTFLSKSFNIPFVHGVGRKCPTEGGAIEICLTGSVGFAGWTAGARGCINVFTGKWRYQFGTNIGAGNGVAVSGGGVYTTCPK